MDAPQSSSDKPDASGKVEPVVPIEPILDQVPENPTPQPASNTPESTPTPTEASSVVPAATATEAAAPPVPVSPIVPAPAVASASTPPSASKPWWKKLWLAGVIIVLLAALSGIYWYVTHQFDKTVSTDHAEHMQTSPALHEIQHIRQKLMVGTDENYEPMEFLQNGQRVGFDIDLGRAIAKELNVPVEFMNVDFESIFADANLGKTNVLTDGSVDILLDSVTINDQRKQYYLFSQSYLNAGQVAITLASNSTIKTAEDLRNKKISVAPSTSNETYALTLTPTAKVMRYKDPVDQAKAVVQGKADAMLVDLTNAKGILSDNPSLKIATDPLTDDNYGVVIAKGKEDLVEKINQILDTLRQRGILESLKQKWLE